MTYTDCMIDFETMSTQPDARILQFGWVFFNRYDRQFRHEGDQRTILQADHQLDRVTDESTKAFWSEQDPALYKRLTSGTTTLTMALATFINAWCRNSTEGTLLWSNPGSFDIAILENLMRYTGFRAPYSHRSFSCFRTALRFHDNIGRVEPEIKHDGLSDAIAQAKTLQCVFHQHRLMEAASNA